MLIIPNTNQQDIFVLHPEQFSSRDIWIYNHNVHAGWKVLIYQQQKGTKYTTEEYFILYDITYTCNESRKISKVVKTV